MSISDDDDDDDDDDEPQQWLGTSPDPAVLEVRRKARRALRLLESQFERLTSPRGEDYAQPRFRRLVEAIESGPAGAIAAYAGKLRSLLYERPEEFLVEDQSKREYLVWHVDNALLRELWKFIEDIQERASSTDKKIPDARFIEDFLKTFTDRVASAITLARMGEQSPSRRAALSRWEDDLEAAKKDFDQTLKAATAAEIATKAAERATKASGLAEQAAGISGAATLGGHFKEVAGKEGRTASWWTGIAVTSLLAVIVAGAFIISRSVTSHWIETLFRLALVLPIVGLAAFSARLASHHRLLSRWAKTSAVQINSVAPFAQQIPTDEGREELILYAGRTVFGPPVFADDSKIENVSGIPTELIELLKEIVHRGSK